jgi:hypothetical protein
MDWHFWRWRKARGKPTFCQKPGMTSAQAARHIGKFNHHNNRPMPEAKPASHVSGRRRSFQAFTSVVPGLAFTLHARLYIMASTTAIHLLRWKQGRQSTHSGLHMSVNALRPVQ